jgi:hypothetical protein
MDQSTGHVSLKDLLSSSSPNLTIIHLAYGTIVTFGELLKILTYTFSSVHNCIYFFHNLHISSCTFIYFCVIDVILLA